MTHIIIVKYAQPEYEKHCIQSVLSTTTIPYDLTVVDNYPRKENLATLWNRLIAQSDAEYVCLLNSDTMVTSGWLEKLVTTLIEHPNAGCVGPSTNHSHNQQSQQPPGEAIVNFGERFPAWCLSGFCLVFPKKVWEEVGGFPEDCGFYGQEVVFIDMLMEKGYAQLWRTDAFVHHEGSVSVKAAVARGEMDEGEERRKARAYRAQRKGQG